MSAAGRLALYVHGLTHTGVVRNTLAVASALAADGHRVEIVTAIPGGAAPEGVDHVVLLGGGGNRGLLDHVAAVPALRRHLRTRRPDIAVSMGNHGHATMWAAAAGLSGIRRVYRVSNDLRRDTAFAPRGNAIKRLVRPLFTRRLVRDSDALVLVSQSLLGDPLLAAAEARGKAVVIPNGVDMAAARRLAGAPSPHPWLDEPKPTVLAIGRLAPQKNFETLLDAVSRLRTAQDARLIILGGGSEEARARLLSRARALGIEERVLLAGTTDNVFAWLARADLFALPSWWEGSANVLLEAMAVGTAVVASRTAGNAAMIVGEDYGRLVDPADAAAMASAIDLQIDPSTRLAPLGRAGQFDLAATLAAWQAFIRRLLDRRPSAG